MKKVFLSALLVAGAGIGFISCNNGAYDADPDIDNTNNGVNPFNPKGGMNTSFAWGGTDPMSAEVNGNPWVASFSSIVPFNGQLIISAGDTSADPKSICTLALTEPLSVDQVIDISWTAVSGNSASFATNYVDPNAIYSSNYGGKGAVKILETDNAHVKGVFYFLGKNPTTGLYINIQKGYFNINK